MNRFVISLLMLLTGSFLSAQNLSFSYAEIAHVNDVQPSFVSGYGGDLVVSVGVSGNGGLDVANTVASSFGSSGITLAGVRCTGFDGEFTLYDVTLHIPAMPSNTFARTLSFHGSEDLSSLSSRQSWETMRGTVSGTGHENLFPGQHFTVSVSGVDRNVAYTLYQDDGFSRSPVETRSSNRYNGTINFDVDEPGTYIVGNGLQFCRGMVHAYQANFFERGFCTSKPVGRHSGFLQMAAVSMSGWTHATVCRSMSLRAMSDCWQMRCTGSGIVTWGSKSSQYSMTTGL